MTWEREAFPYTPDGRRDLIEAAESRIGGHYVAPAHTAQWRTDIERGNPLTIAFTGGTLLISGGLPLYRRIWSSLGEVVRHNTQETTIPWTPQGTPDYVYVEDSIGQQAQAAVIYPGNPQFPTITALDGPDLYRLDYLSSDPDTYADVLVPVTNLGGRTVVVSSPGAPDTSIVGGATVNVPVRLSLTLAHGTDTYALARTLTWTDGATASGTWDCTATGLAVPWIAHFYRSVPQARSSGCRALIDAAGNLHFANGDPATGVTIGTAPGGLTWVDPGSQGHTISDDYQDVIPLGASLLTSMFPKVSSGSLVQSLMRALDSDDNARVSYRGWRPANIASLPTRLRNKFDLRTWWAFRGPSALATYAPQTVYGGSVVIRDWSDPNRIAGIYDGDANVGPGYTASLVETTDGGLTWAKRTITEPLGSIDRGIIRGSLYLYASTASQIARSTDGGVTFAAVTPSLGGTYKLANRDLVSGKRRPTPFWDPVNNRIGWPLEPVTTLLGAFQSATPPPPAIGWTSDGVTWTVETLPAVYYAGLVTNPNPFPISLPYDQIGNVWCHPNGDRFYSLTDSAVTTKSTVLKNGVALGTWTSGTLLEMYPSTKGTVLTLWSGTPTGEENKLYRSGSWTNIGSAIFASGGAAVSVSIISDGVW